MSTADQDLFRQLWFHPESDCYIETFSQLQADRLFANSCDGCDDVTGTPHHEQKFREYYKTETAAYRVDEFKGQQTFAAWMTIKNDIQHLAGIVQNGEMPVTLQQKAEWDDDVRKLVKKIDVLKRLTDTSLNKTEWKIDRDRYHLLKEDEGRESMAANWSKK